MVLVPKILRKVFKQWERLVNLLLILRIKMLYPAVSIDFKTKIEKGCSIICVDGAKLSIKNSHISFGTLIKADSGSSVSITNSFIGRNCVIVGKLKINICKNCLIAEMVVIRDQDHSINPSSRNSFSTAPIEIRENVWIASKATILKGVTIGTNSVVAASAVVTKNVPSMELWGGVPAYQLKKLSEEMQLTSSAGFLNEQQFYQ